MEQNPARTKEAELALMSRLSDAKKEVKRCLCDDFDTPGAVGALQELVKAVNRVRAWRVEVSFCRRLRVAFDGVCFSYSESLALASEGRRTSGGASG